MIDDNFTEYQKLRASAENEIKNHFLSWALSDAPADLTIDNVRKLADAIVLILNGSTRRAYDLGARSKAEKE